MPITHEEAMKIGFVDDNINEPVGDNLAAVLQHRQQMLQESPVYQQYQESPKATQFLHGLFGEELVSKEGERFKDVIPEPQTLGEGLSRVGGELLLDIPTFLAAERLNPAKFIKYGKNVSKLGRLATMD